MAEHATTPAPRDLASQYDTMDTRAHTLGVGESWGYTCMQDNYQVRLSHKTYLLRPMVACLGIIMEHCSLA